MLIVTFALAALALAGYVACFVFAAQTGKLKVSDYLIGSLGMLCGVGTFYFLYRANAVTLRHSFDMIDRGGDPAASRALNKRFKLAAGVAIVGTVLLIFVGRSSGS